MLVLLQKSRIRQTSFKPTLPSAPSRRPSHSTRHGSYSAISISWARKRDPLLERLTGQFRWRRTACAPLLTDCQPKQPAQIPQVQLTENALLLAVFKRWVRSEHGTEVVVLYLLLICVDEVSPPLLAFLTLHFVLVDGCLQVIVGELAFEMIENFIVHLCEPELGARHLFEDCPVGGHVLDDYNDQRLVHGNDKVIWLLSYP